MVDKKKRVTLSGMSNLVENIKVDHDIPVLERIKYPIVWERIASGYRIQDLQPSKIDNAIEIIKAYYIHEEILCRGVNLNQDADAVAEYLSHVGVWLRDTQSLAAVEEGSGVVVGVLIGRVLDRTVRTQMRMTMQTSFSRPLLLDEKLTLTSIKECPPLACDNAVNLHSIKEKKKKSVTTKSEKKDGKTNLDSKTGDLKSEKSKSIGKLSRPSKHVSSSSESKETGLRFFRRILIPMFDDEYTIVHNPTLRHIHKFKSYLTSKVNVFDIFDVDIYYSIYLLLVVPNHRGKGIAKALIRCSIEMSKKLTCDVISGIFTSDVSQNIAHKEGFKTREELRLSDWLENGEEVFSGVDGSEHVAAVMTYKMEPMEPSPGQAQLRPPRRSIKPKS